MRVIIWCFLLFGVLQPHAAYAWDDGGHMIVAQIAYERLSPEARAQADALMAQLKNPAVPTQKFSFVTAACWMDDIRQVEGYEHMKPWHFINRTCQGHDPEAPHALSALRECLAALRDRSTPEAMRAQALAVLLHVVGDVHQPLHSIDTDLGGNTYPISGIPELWLGIAENGAPVTESNPAKYQRLHAYWDSAYRYGILSETNNAIKLLYHAGRSAQPNMKLVRLAAADMQRFVPDDKSLLSELDASRWVSESNTLACNFVFETPRKQQPSIGYVTRARNEACRRLVLAGYRMSALLNRMIATQPNNS